MRAKTDKSEARIESAYKMIGESIALLTLAKRILKKEMLVGEIWDMTLSQEINRLRDILEGRDVSGG